MRQTALDRTCWVGACLALVAVIAVAAGCALPAATDSGARMTSGVAQPEQPRVRQVGRADAGTVVVLRVGEQLRVTLDAGTCAQMWRLSDYPGALLRPETSRARTAGCSPPSLSGTVSSC